MGRGRPLTKKEIPDGLNWIEWNGGENPIPLGKEFYVEARVNRDEAYAPLADFFAGGTYFHSFEELDTPNSFKWEHTGDLSDIVAYAIVEA